MQQRRERKLKGLEDYNAIVIILGLPIFDSNSAAAISGIPWASVLIHDV